MLENCDIFVAPPLYFSIGEDVTKDSFLLDRLRILNNLLDEIPGEASASGTGEQRKCIEKKPSQVCLTNKE
jgi:hypothetical protein